MEGHRYAECWHVLEADWVVTTEALLCRLLRKRQATGDVKDRPRPGRPRCTTPREDRQLFRLVRRFPFANSTDLKRMWLPRRQISMGTVRNRLHSAGYRARRPVKRPLLTRQHKQKRLGWCQARRRWNVANWRKVHWSVSFVND